VSKNIPITLSSLAISLHESNLPIISAVIITAFELHAHFPVAGHTAGMNQDDDYDYKSTMSSRRASEAEVTTQTQSAVELHRATIMYT